MSEWMALRSKPGMSRQQCRAVPWFNIDGDNTLRLNYKLNQDSVVYDVGGYEGAWADDIYKKYKCIVEVFEPVKAFADKLEEKFADNPKINVHAVGLADKTRRVSITHSGASSSTHKSKQDSEIVQLIRAGDFIKDRHKKIDLMKINIEGDEFPLLEHLIKSGLIKRIDNVQVQFHSFVTGAKKRRQKIQQELSKTHYLTYSYPWIWENWRRCQ